MSYSKKYEYKIVPRESFQIRHNCAKCGKKTLFVNTHCFRVNANGNKLDVWLIYQCENCKHTKNLTIYERMSPSKILKQDYERFLSNDIAFAETYGKNKEFFQKNKAEIDWGKVSYDYYNTVDECMAEMPETLYEDDILSVEDPYHLNLRAEQILADILKCSKSKAKKMLISGAVQAVKNVSFRGAFGGIEFCFRKRLSLQSDKFADCSNEKEKE